MSLIESVKFQTTDCGKQVSFGGLFTGNTCSNFTERVDIPASEYRRMLAKIDDLEKKNKNLNVLNKELEKSVDAVMKRALENPFEVKRILKNGDYMTVLWADGAKTIVKRASDEPQSDYAAFTACLGIRAYGSNSALKRLVASAEVQGKKKKKKKDPTTPEEVRERITQGFAQARKDMREKEDEAAVDEWLDRIEKTNDNRS